MRRSFLFEIVLLLALVILSACGAASTPAPTTLSPTSVPPTIAPTNTPLPTNTPAPTNTPKPTSTPRPTATFTPTPAPIELTGKGDSIVKVEKWHGPALAHIKYASGGNFSIWSMDRTMKKLIYWLILLENMKVLLH